MNAEGGVHNGAVVLSSGGLDSTTLLATARAQRRTIYALSFRYGQRHARELDCARRQAQRFGAMQHRVLDLHQLSELVAGATSLVEQSTLDVPHDRNVDDTSEIPTTYVPARNTLFLAYATAWAESLGAREIWIGANALDYSGYPDCRPAFFESFERTANLGTRAIETGDRLRIVAPLLHLHKHEIIDLGLRHGVDYGDTLSCYSPVDDGERALACGRCDSCQLRRRGFTQAGTPDPTAYVDAQ